MNCFYYNLVFWNVDTQYDFMRNDDDHHGTLAIPGAKTIEEKLQQLTNIAKKYNITVVNTADWHTEQTKEISKTPDFITTFPAHCMQHTKGAAFIPATAPEQPYIIDYAPDTLIDDIKLQDTRNIVIYKDDFDVFKGNPHIDKMFTSFGLFKPAIAIVYGVATNVCVDKAVRGLRSRGIETYVVSDAIKELPNIPITPVYNAWKDLGVKFTPVDNLQSLMFELFKDNHTR